MKLHVGPWYPDAHNQVYTFRSSTSPTNIYPIFTSPFLVFVFECHSNETREEKRARPRVRKTSHSSVLYEFDKMYRKTSLFYALLASRKLWWTCPFNINENQPEDINCRRKVYALLHLQFCHPLKWRKLFSFFPCYFLFFWWPLWLPSRWDADLLSRELHLSKRLNFFF